MYAFPSRSHVMDGQWAGEAQLTRLTSAYNSTTLQIKVSASVSYLSLSSLQYQKGTGKIPNQFLVASLMNEV